MQLCDCPERPPPLSGGEKLCRIVTFLVKGAIGSGLVYWTWSEGFWGDSSKTEDLYYRIVRTVTHAVKGRPPNDSDVNMNIKMDLLCP